MTNAVLTKQVDSYDLYKQQLQRDKIRSKTSSIKAMARLMENVIGGISCRIEEEVRNAKKEDRYLTDFENEMWNWEETFMDIILALRGIADEAKEADAVLSEIMHFVHAKTGMILNYTANKED